MKTDSAPLSGDLNGGAAAPRLGTWGCGHMRLWAHAAVAYGDDGDDGSVDNWHPSPSAQCLYLPLLFVRIVDLLFVSRQTPVLSRKVICITSMRSVKTHRPTDDQNTT